VDANKAFLKMETKKENFGLTPYQTVGPYYSIGFEHLYKKQLFREEDKSKHITVSGKILDGENNPVIDAVIEIWQADEHGNYRPGNAGFARVSADLNGQYIFKTIKPGAVTNGKSAKHAPHLNVLIFLRGALKGLKTRIYFEDEFTMNELDQVLRLVPNQRKHTLLAMSPQKQVYKIDFILQGENETVFFDY